MVSRQPESGKRFFRLPLSDGNGGFNVRVRVVVLQFEVFKAEVEQVLHFGVELHLRQGSRLAGELEARA